MAKPKRTTLRDKLNDTTRELIVDATIAQLNERGPYEFSYFELSRRAGVSVRTIYRHFPTREELFDALSRRANRAVGFEYPRTRDGLVTLVRSLFLMFEKHGALMTAQIQAGVGKVKVRSRSKRIGVMQAVIAAVLPNLPTERHVAASGILTVLLSAATWQRLRDEHGLDGAAAGEVSSWAIDTLWRALEAEDERARAAAP
jgi:AcrR family transcriptional regulator